MTALVEGTGSPKKCKRHVWQYERWEGWKRSCKNCGVKQVWGAQSSPQPPKGQANE
jgi:hypothetical protein